MTFYDSVPFPFGEGHNIRYTNEPLTPRHKEPRRYAFVWPRDGKEKGHHRPSSRLRDIFSGQGPDMFVAANGQRPLRTRWSNRPWLDPLAVDMTTHPMRWAGRKDEAYNFRTRRYGKERVTGLHDGVAHAVGPTPFKWVDVRWGEHKATPLSYRCSRGHWCQLTGEGGVY
jgi:hypothetical protein